MERSATVFCIICGNAFRPADEETVICPACGRPPEAPGAEAPQKAVFTDRMPDIPPVTDGRPPSPEAMDTPVPGAERRYCIVCGNEFYTTEDAVRCPACGGPPEAPGGDRPQKTVLMSESQGRVVMETGSTPITGTGQAALPARTFAAEADVPLQWEVGNTILDVYQVKELLGEGGMGVVYRVHHIQWDIDLAVKTPRQEALEKAGGQEAFIGEAEAWIELGLHPHIVTCYYVRTLGGVPRVFSEFVEGGSLKDWIRDRRLYAGGEQEALRRMLDVAIQFAWGLGYAHEKGLVHQDVKPANALMTPDGMLKVTDFGLVRSKGYTQAYAAPEQILGREVDPRTDIWGWGVSVLEMFKGEVTWVEGSIAASVLEDYLANPPADLPRMPLGLAELLRECFQDDPALRPPDMDTVVQRLVEVYRQELGEPYPRTKPSALDLRADSLNNRAVSYLDLGREEEAVRCWQEALQIDPAHLEANFNYGYYRWQRAELPGSRFLEEFRALEDRHRSRSEYWSMLGWIYLEQGNVREAEKLRDKIRDKKFLHALDNGTHPKVNAMKKVEGNGPARFSPDAQSLLFQTEFEPNIPAIILWDLKTDEKRRYLCGGLGWARSIAFSPEGDFAVWGCEKGIVCWNISTKGVRRLLGMTSLLLRANKVRSIVFAPEGKCIFSGDENGFIRVWDITSGKEIFRWEVPSVVKGVDAIDISPSGQYLVSGGYDNLIRVWDLKNDRQCVRQMMVDDPISVRFSPNGNFVLSGNGDGTLCLWNLADGKPFLWFKAHRGYIVSVDISPDGRFAISGSADRTARLWEMKTGREICLLSHSDQVTSVSFSPDSSMAITCGGGSVYIWEINYPQEWLGIPIYPVLSRSSYIQEVEERQLNARKLLRLAQSNLARLDYPDAQNILRQIQSIPGYERDRNVLQLLSKCGTKQIRIGLRSAWRLHSIDTGAAINAVSVSPDGKYVISGGEDKIVRVYEIESGKQLYRLDGHRSGIGYVSISQTGNLALSACGNFLIAWDLVKGKEIARSEGLCPVFTGIHLAALAPQGRWALIQTGDPLESTVIAYLWAIASGEMMKLRWLPKHTYNKPEYCVFSPDERYIISVNQRNKTLSIWDTWDIVLGHWRDYVIRETRCIATNLSSSERITCFNISPDGRYAILGTHDDNNMVLVNVLDIEKEQMVCRFEGHTGVVRSFIPVPDGKFLLSGGDDKTVRVWDLANGKEIYCLQGHTDRIKSIAISADGQYAVSGSWDKTVCVWVFDWEYDFPGWADWDEGARPYLDIFLTLHTPYGPDGLSRVGAPQWTEADFQNLLTELGRRGYGWLRPEGVRRKLEEMARARGWKGG